MGTNPFFSSNRVIQMVCPEEEMKGKFHQNWD
jgi:hypothetical protein